MSGMEGMTERTDEQVVKQKWPHAHFLPPVMGIPSRKNYFIMGVKSRQGYSYQWLGEGTSEADAWHDAAERIRKERP